MQLHIVLQLILISFQEPIMSRLIAAYRKLPSPTNRAKLQAYLRKHMMAVCLATPEDLAFLKAHDFII